MEPLEVCRLIKGLRKLGLDDKQVVDFLLWVAGSDAEIDFFPEKV